MKRSAPESDVVTAEGDSGVVINASNIETKLPNKRFFRSRAHCNPLSHNDSFKYPLNPNVADWEFHYPNIPVEQRIVRHVDVGMGYGGLTVALATLFPDTLVLGMEIRAKLVEYVRLKIEALRNLEAGGYQNASCMRTNCMRYLPNYFVKGQLHKIFFCFPDPHFKAKNFRRRIISTVLLSEYAYFLAPNARLYAITDVEELHKWHVEKLTEHPCFERIDNEVALSEDPCVRAMIEETEEGKKVARLGGSKYYCVFRRLPDEEVRPASIMQLWEGK